MKYNIVKENSITLTEVFENLKHGGLKLLYFNKKENNVSEVNWFPDNKIEIITIENDKEVAHYFTSFPFDSPIEMTNCGNKSFSNSEGWFIGHIED